MGYMGLGMQRWIYQTSIRKPFEKPHLKRYDTHNFTQPHEITLEGRFNKSQQGSKERVKNGIKKLNANKRNYLIFAFIYLLAAMCFMYFITTVSNQKLAYPLSKAESAEEVAERLRLFISYGDKKMRNKEWEAAFREYTEALKLLPNDSLLKFKQQQALLNLCIIDGKNCVLE